MTPTISIMSSRTSHGVLESCRTARRLPENFQELKKMFLLRFMWLVAVFGIIPELCVSMRMKLE